MVLEGHCRSGRFIGGKGWYFVEGSLSLERGVSHKIVTRNHRHCPAIVVGVVSYIGILGEMWSSAWSERW